MGDHIYVKDPVYLQLLVVLMPPEEKLYSVPQLKYLSYGEEPLQGQGFGSVLTNLHAKYSLAHTSVQLLLKEEKSPSEMVLTLTNIDV